MRQSVGMATLGSALVFIWLGGACSFGRSEGDSDFLIHGGAGDAGTSDDDADGNGADDGVYGRLQPSGPVMGKTFGLASQMSGASDDRWKRDFEAQTLSRMGVGRIRVGFSWEDVEPENDVWDWERTDALNEVGLDNGLSWDARLAYTTDWAAPGGSPSEIDPDAFADYAAHVAERYCEDIKLYEIWNEPNLYHFWAPTPDPAHYGRLLKAAYSAVKRVCPDAEVAFGGLSSNNFSQEFYFNTYPFFDRVALEHPDICDYFDLMPIHPYTVLQMQRPEAEIELFGFNAPNLPGQVDDIRRRMAASGCDEKPVLFTEFGYPSTYLGVRLQATFLVRTILLGATREVTGYYLYTFWNKTGREPPTENDFGLYEYPTTPDAETFVPKASFFAYRTLIQMLGSTRFSGDLSRLLSLPKNVYALAFKDENTGRLVLAIWDGRATPEAFEVSVPSPAGTDRIRVVNIDGDVIAKDTDDPALVSISSDVQYLEFIPAEGLFQN